MEGRQGGGTGSWREVGVDEYDQNILYRRIMFQTISKNIILKNFSGDSLLNLEFQATRIICFSNLLGFMHIDEDSSRSISSIFPLPSQSCSKELFQAGIKSRSQKRCLLGTPLTLQLKQSSLSPIHGFSIGRALSRSEDLKLYPVS